MERAAGEKIKERIASRENAPNPTLLFFDRRFSRCDPTERLEEARITMTRPLTRLYYIVYGPLLSKLASQSIGWSVSHSASRTVG